MINNSNFKTVNFLSQNINYTRMNLSIHSLNTKLITSLQKESIPLGLADGKMGFCIYFYYLSSVYANTDYKETAEKLLDDIFKDIDTINTIDVKHGLAGIGLGVGYLIKNSYVKGNINVILKDLDDVIFKNLSYPKYYEKIDSLSLIHILYYLYVRLKQRKQGGEDEYLYRELVIQTVNNLYERIDLGFYEEPLAYNIDYPLPQLLFVLSKLYSLDFYNYRLIKIVEELSYKALSVLPILHANRLYLLWGMDALNKQIKDEQWEKHIGLLKEQIDITHIFNQELRDKNIYFNDGIASLCYFIHSLSDYFGGEELDTIGKQAVERIDSSGVWELLENNPQYFDTHTGLYNGFMGVSLLLQYLKSSNL
jgi:lantibiotic modifying enzyme